MYLLPQMETGRGPKISIATHSKGHDERSACMAALGFVGGALRVAQLSHAAHHFSMSHHCPGQ